MMCPSRDEATRAMQIAGADDPAEAKEAFKARQRKAKTKSRQKITFSGDTTSSPKKVP
jgi:hypothetical protein